MVGLLKWTALLADTGCPPLMAPHGRSGQWRLLAANALRGPSETDCQGPCLQGQIMSGTTPWSLGWGTLPPWDGIQFQNCFQWPWCHWGHLNEPSCSPLAPSALVALYPPVHRSHSTGCSPVGIPPRVHWGHPSRELFISLLPPRLPFMLIRISVSWRQTAQQTEATSGTHCPCWGGVVSASCLPRAGLCSEPGSLDVSPMTPNFLCWNNSILKLLRREKTNAQ